MSLNSVNTNMGAMVALQSLEKTQQQLAVTQKQISTGFRVADATDDGAAYAVAQGIRSTVGALTSVNQQLGNAQGLLQTTQTALNNVSNTMASMRDVLTRLGDTSLTTDERNNYTTQYNALQASVKSVISDATYNGKSLIGNIGTGAVASSVAIPQDENGTAYGIKSISGSCIFTGVSLSASGGTLSSTTALAQLTATGGFISWQSKVGTDLNKIGSAINFVNSQTTYNNDKIDALNGGLGSLVDADLAKESAQLTALQIRQQLGTQALSLSNQAPQSLLSLFK
jgi:flagellin